MKTTFRCWGLVLGVITMIAIPSVGGAAMKSPMRMLSVSGGIAVPSYQIAAFQNPAGLAYVPRFNLSLQGGSDTGFNTPGGSVGLLYGSRFFGLAAGATGVSVASELATSAFYGGGFNIGNKVALGVAGSTGISPTTTTNINAGLLISPAAAFDLGFTAFGITGNAIEWGAGISVNLGNAARLVFDATSNQDFSIFNFEPGLLIGDSRAALTVSYGFGNGGSTQIQDGIGAGGHLMLGKAVSWEVYYQTLNELYTAITFMF